MRDYVNKSGDLFICPTGLNKGEVVKNGTAPASGTQWTIKNTWFTGLSYRYNNYFGNYGAGPGQYPQKVTLRPRRLAFFTHPGHVIALVDADPNTGTWHLPTFSFDYLSLPAVSRDRHTDGENYLFVDGHATRDHVKNNASRTVPT